MHKVISKQTHSLLGITLRHFFKRARKILPLLACCNFPLYSSKLLLNLLSLKAALPLRLCTRTETRQSGQTSIPWIPLS